MGVYLYPNNTETELKNAYIGIPNPTSIVLDKSSIALTTIGQTEQLTATIEPTISDHSITWSSDDTTVATVSTTGLVTCVSLGECTITATTVNNLTATCGVTDQSGWQPGVNTIAYYPLTSVSTVNDMSGNSNTLTNSNVTFGVNQGVDCAVSNGSNYLSANITSIPLGTSARTMSVWVYINSMTSNTEYNTIGYGNNGYHQSFQIYESGYNLISIRIYYDDAGTGYWDSAWYQNWINIMGTYDGSTARLYVNGVQVATSNVSLATSGSTLYIGKGFVGNGTKGYISEAIIEDKCWTAQEVEDYFNLTKGNYGIS